MDHRTMNDTRVLGLSSDEASRLLCEHVGDCLATVAKPSRLASFLAVLRAHPPILLLIVVLIPCCCVAAATLSANASPLLDLGLLVFLAMAHVILVGRSELRAAGCRYQRAMNVLHLCRALRSCTWDSSMDAELRLRRGDLCTDVPCLRDGVWRFMPANLLAPSDVIQLIPGDTAPADVTLVPTSVPSAENLPRKLAQGHVLRLVPPGSAAGVSPLDTAAVEDPDTLSTASTDGEFGARQLWKSRTLGSTADMRDQGVDVVAAGSNASMWQVSNCPAEALVRQFLQAEADAGLDQAAQSALRRPITVALCVYHVVVLAAVLIRYAVHPSFYDWTDAILMRFAHASVPALLVHVPLFQTLIQAWANAFLFVFMETAREDACPPQRSEEATDTTGAGALSDPWLCDRSRAAVGTGDAGGEAAGGDGIPQDEEGGASTDTNTTPTSSSTWDVEQPRGPGIPSSVSSAHSSISEDDSSTSEDALDPGADQWDQPPWGRVLRTVGSLLWSLDHKVSVQRDLDRKLLPSLSTITVVVSAKVTGIIAHAMTMPSRIAVMDHANERQDMLLSDVHTGRDPDHPYSIYFNDTTRQKHHEGVLKPLALNAILNSQCSPLHRLRSQQQLQQQLVAKLGASAWVRTRCQCQCALSHRLGWRQSSLQGYRVLEQLHTLARLRNAPSILAHHNARHFRARQQALADPGAGNASTGTSTQASLAPPSTVSIASPSPTASSVTVATTATMTGAAGSATAGGSQMSDVVPTTGASMSPSSSHSSLEALDAIDGIPSTARKYAAMARRQRRRRRRERMARAVAAAAENGSATGSLTSTARGSSIVGSGSMVADDRVSMEAMMLASDGGVAGSVGGGSIGGGSSGGGSGVGVAFAEGSPTLPTLTQPPGTGVLMATGPSKPVRHSYSGGGPGDVNVSFSRASDVASLLDDYVYQVQSSTGPPAPGATVTRLSLEDRDGTRRKRTPPGRRLRWGDGVDFTEPSVNSDGVSVATERSSEAIKGIAPAEGAQSEDSKPLSDVIVSDGDERDCGEQHVRDPSRQVPATDAGALFTRTDAALEDAPPRTPVNRYPAAPHGAALNGNGDTELKPRQLAHMQSSIVVNEDRRRDPAQLLTNGNPELVLAHCQYFWNGRAVCPLTPYLRLQLLRKIQTWNRLMPTVSAFSFKLLPPLLAMQAEQGGADDHEPERVADGGDVGQSEAGNARVATGGGGGGGGSTDAAVSESPPDALLELCRVHPPYSLDALVELADREEAAMLQREREGIEARKLALAAPVASSESDDGTDSVTSAGAGNGATSSASTSDDINEEGEDDESSLDPALATPPTAQDPVSDSGTTGGVGVGSDGGSDARLSDDMAFVPRGSLDELTHRSSFRHQLRLRVRQWWKRRRSRIRRSPSQPGSGVTLSDDATPSSRRLLPGRMSLDEKRLRTTPVVRVDGSIDGGGDYDSGSQNEDAGSWKAATAHSDGESYSRSYAHTPNLERKSRRRSHHSGAGFHGTNSSDSLGQGSPRPYRAQHHGASSDVDDDDRLSDSGSGLGPMDAGLQRVPSKRLYFGDCKDATVLVGRYSLDLPRARRQLAASTVPDRLRALVREGEHDRANRDVLADVSSARDPDDDDATVSDGGMQPGASGVVEAGDEPGNMAHEGVIGVAMDATAVVLGSCDAASSDSDDSSEVSSGSSAGRSVSWNLPRTVPTSSSGSDDSSSGSSEVGASPPTRAAARVAMTGMPTTNVGVSFTAPSDASMHSGGDGVEDTKDVSRDEEATTGGVIIGADMDPACVSPSVDTQEATFVPDERFRSQVVPGDQIFMGILSRRQLAPVPHLAESVQGIRMAGIRFVYCTRLSDKVSRSLANKIQLRTDWNWNFSLGNGVEPLEYHLDNIDDIPLRIPSFSDVSYECLPQLLRVFKEHHDYVLVVGSLTDHHHSRLWSHADVCVGVLSPGAQCVRRLRHQQLHPRQDVTAMLEHSQAVGAVDDGDVVKPIVCAHHAALEGSQGKDGGCDDGGEADPQRAPCAECCALQADVVNEVSIGLADLGCQLKLSPERDGFGVMNALSQMLVRARTMVHHSGHATAFVSLVGVFLAMVQLVALLIALPMPLRVLHCVWLLVVVAPLLGTALALRGAALPDAYLRKRIPPKRDEVLREWGSPRLVLTMVAWELLAFLVPAVLCVLCFLWTATRFLPDEPGFSDLMGNLRMSGGDGEAAVAGLHVARLVCLVAVTLALVAQAATRIAPHVTLWHCFVGQRAFGPWLVVSVTCFALTLAWLLLGVTVTPGSVAILGDVPAAVWFLALVAVPLTTVVPLELVRRHFRSIQHENDQFRALDFDIRLGRDSPGKTPLTPIL